MGLFGEDEGWVPLADIGIEAATQRLEAVVKSGAVLPETAAAIFATANAARDRQ
jgi:hypothetical protein